MHKKYTFKDLLEIIEKLRSKDGCPWDREQTLQTLKKYILEEAYEVVDAIDEGSYEKIQEELGDVLLQVVFQSQIAREENRFNIDDVTNSICEKLINRHPHVFGNEHFSTAKEVSKKWQEIKKQEKDLNSYTQAIKNIPKSMSALMRSYEIQKKVSQVGFDWNNAEDAFKKVYEEIDEVKELIGTRQKEEISKEIGDLIFAIVNVARLLDIDCETALISTNNKFINRFEYIEKNSAKNGKKLENMTLQEMDELWEQSKKFFK